MIISEELLYSHGAELRNYLAGEFIFKEDTAAKYYFQINKGIVKINNIFEDGKEFVHGFPYDGHCFGETYLFTDNRYMINAIALTDCNIIRLSKNNFLEMMTENPSLFFNINRYTADRLHFRYMISSLLAVSDPFIRVKKLLDHLKKYFNYPEKYSFLIPFTRQQLASLIGLRVETVIRTIKKMQRTNLLKIDGNKIYY